MSQAVNVDARWNGNHGIGRYAREILHCLPPSFRRINGKLSPTSPVDVFFRPRREAAADSIWYSPGFNAGPGHVRQLLTIHDLIHLDQDDEKSLLKSVYYNIVVKPQILRTGMVLTVSEASAARIRQWLNNEDVEIRVTHCGLSADFVLTTNESGLRAGNLLYVGNMKAHKNVDLLLSAVKMMPQARLDVITSDVFDAKVKISELNLQRQVTIRTGLSDSELGDLYRNSKAVVMPSLHEGFGLPALEASAAGTPVIHWQGCASVSEIVDNPEYSFASATDANELMGLMTRASTGELGSVRKPDGWFEKYTWGSAASVVQGAIQDVAQR